MAKKPNKKNAGKRFSQAGSVRPKKIKPLSNEQTQLLQQAYQLHHQGRFNEAVNLYGTVLSQRPDFPEASFLFGMLKYSLGHYGESEQALVKACQLNPSEGRYLVALGSLYLKVGESDAAANVLEKAILVAPRVFEPHFYLGNARSEQHRYSEAIELYETALKINPKHAWAFNNLGHAYQGLCETDKAIDMFEKAFALDNKLLSSLSNSLMNRNYLDSLTPDAVFQEHLRCKKDFPNSDWSADISPAKESKIRLGFVSADFKIHSVAYFLLPLLEHIDKTRFEIYCYYHGDKIDDMTRTFQSIADNWLRINNLTDGQFVTAAREHKIDIMFDLSGHTGDNRLSAFAHRMAPIQINWLGYPHSTGVPNMDYRIIDESTDPEAYADALSSETLLRMQNGFLCFQGNNEIRAKTQAPLVENGHITFCSFNNLSKVTNTAISAWCEILNAVPNSRMILKSRQLGEKSVADKVASQFLAGGIDKDRLDLLSYVPGQKGHLALYDQADIALDTFPYNGTTTTCEALWMGVPTITFAGDRHASRVGASILKQAGLEQFIAKDERDYVKLAIDFATNPAELNEVRATAREQLKQSRLCDAKAFAEEMQWLLVSLLDSRR